MAEHPAASLYHTWSWQRALQAAGFGRPIYLVATAGNDLLGVFPLVESTNTRGPRRLLSLPATPAGGILADDAATRWLLASRAVALAEARSFEGVWIRSFDRRGLAAPVDAELDWVRLPASAVFEHAERLGRTSNGEVCVEAFRSSDLARLPRPRNDRATAILDSLARHSAVPLRAAVRRSGHHLAVRAVWTTVNAHVHMLYYAADDGTCSADGVHLLDLAAREGRSNHADWIDFPGPLAQDSDLAPLLDGPQAQFACERRLALDALDP